MSRFQTKTIFMLWPFPNARAHCIPDGTRGEVPERRFYKDEDLPGMDPIFTPSSVVGMLDFGSV